MASCDFEQNESTQSKRHEILQSKSDASLHSALNFAMILPTCMRLFREDLPWDNKIRTALRHHSEFI